MRDLIARRFPCARAAPEHQKSSPQRVISSPYVPQLPAAYATGSTLLLDVSADLSKAKALHVLKFFSLS
jgi:hypothetical protein